MEEFFENYTAGFAFEPGLASVLTDLVAVFPRVAEALKTSQLGYAGSENSYGERQLKLDVYSNQLFQDALLKNLHVSSIASEELPEEIKGKGGSDGYSVAFDPLDGSSLVDVNLAVGSIIGIYKGDGFIGRKGSEQVAALIVVYGPRLTFMITHGKGVFEYLYKDAVGKFAGNGVVKLDSGKKYFAPGNLRVSASEAWYVKLMEHWMKNEYTLRYSGGMVPDVNHLLKKGGGIFTYPGSKEKPEGKLRLLYECAPMAFLMEQAGGMACDQRGVRILDLEVQKLDQRTPIFLGAKQEVELVQKFMS